MFDILTYNDLNTSTVKKQFNKVVNQLSNGDFISAEVKKMPGKGLFRAKLDYENRLLFKFGKYNDKTCILLLETILNHEYEKSRFLRGAAIDETKLLALGRYDEVLEEDHIELPYINKEQSHFHLLDKVLSFDNDQNEIFAMPLPLIIIGSAGSGKTALTIEKLKTLKGKILYVTLSPYLAENSANLFYSNGYENDKVDIDFLSFREFIETIKVPKGKEIDFKIFESWMERYKQAFKLKDAHKVFEEFRGVITGMDINKEYLSKDEYLSLGIKQSIFLAEERKQVYGLFEKYLQFLKEGEYYDINIVSHVWLPHCQPVYDFIVIDEVQDLTNIQLYIILKSLVKPTQFLLCGDSNQVVHPNFFSWSSVKTMFYNNDIKADLIKILHTNFRNSHAVSEKANNLLKIKNARFGSVDRESNYLVNTISKHPGEIIFLEQNNKNVAELNRKTFKSSHYAVLVMRDEDKPQARKHFQTPLVFSVQESKGLEYENIILFNLVTGNSKEFTRITDGVAHGQLKADELKYSRAKDKSDKDLEVYKFYINSLYVAITRGIKNVFIVEPSKGHKLLSLLEIVEKKENLQIKEEISSEEEWKREARRLELQGKKEQSEAIRKNILSIEKPTWEVITLERYKKLLEEALDPGNFNKKAKDRLFDFSLIHGQSFIMNKLSALKYRKADNYESEQGSIFRKHYQGYKNDNLKNILPQVNKYGINYRDIYNFTPLHAAAFSGAVKITNALIENGANPKLTDTFFKTPLQISVARAFISKDYAKNNLGSIYPLLVTDSIKVKIDEKLIKIDNHKIEYILLNLLIAVQSIILQKKEWNEEVAIRMDDILDSLSYFSNSILPEYRKKRQYLNSILSKHEINSNAPYNKKLFKRVARGNYVLNEDMQIFHDEQWIPLTDILLVQEADREEVAKFSMEKFQKKLEEDRKRIEKYRRREEWGWGW